MLHIWHIARNVKSQALGPQFHGNQDYVTIKVKSRRMFVLEELQRTDGCCDEEIPYKYLALVIIDVVNKTSGLKRNQIEDLLLDLLLWIDNLATQQQELNSAND